MTEGEFTRLLERFAIKPVTATTGRHVYLWHGRNERLERMVPALALHVLDLHALAVAAPRTPFGQSEAVRVLQRLIEDWLAKHLGKGGQQIIVVTGCDLLGRYHVPLTAFFQWASDTTMFVLAVEESQGLALAGQMPGYVQFNPLNSFTYLKEIVGEPGIIQTEG